MNKYKRADIFMKALKSQQQDIDYSDKAIKGELISTLLKRIN